MERILTLFRMTFDKDYLQPFPNEVRFIYVHVVDVIFGYINSPKSRFSQIMRKTSIKCILNFTSRNTAREIGA